MFEGLGALFDGWRAIAHVAEYTGLSIGVLLGLVVLVLLDRNLLGITIKIGVAVAIGYATLMFGMHMGSADKQAQWDAANVRAEKARVARDASIAADTERKYAGLVASLQSETAELQDQVRAYEHDRLQVSAGSGRCRLDPAALRLRRRPR